MSDEEITTTEDEEVKKIVRVTDDFTLAVINTETGEILSIEDAPGKDTDVQDIVDWISMRRSKATARLAGLQAEKADWIAKIDRKYDVGIRHLTSFIAYLDYTYKPLLEGYAKEALAGKKSKTLRIGFLELSFSTTRPRVDVIDVDKAVAYCKKAKLKTAIKVAESVLKSMIPEKIKVKLTADKQDETGLFFYPGGEDEFKIK